MIHIAIALTGCISSTSPGLAQVYLLRLSSSAPSNTVAVNVGYFGTSLKYSNKRSVIDELLGICVIIGDNTQCSASSGNAASSLMSNFFTSDRALFSAAFAEKANKATTSNMLDVAMLFQTKVMICVLAASGVLFFMGLIANAAEAIRHARRKHGKTSNTGDNSRLLSLRKLARASNWLAIAFALAATLGLVETVGGLQTFTAHAPGPLQVTAGATAQGIHWAIVCLLLVFTISLSALRPFEDSATTGGSSIRATGLSRPGFAKPRPALGGAGLKRAPVAASKPAGNSPLDV